MTPLQRFLKEESGTATIEFVFIVPIVMTIFMASVESSLYMARYAMLERSVDQVVRDVRLGIATGMQHGDLKRAICERSALVQSIDTCVDSMQIWMQPINTANFLMPTTPTGCVDRSEDVEALVEPTADEFAYGSDNEVMLIRVCLKERPMFPTTAVGAQLIWDEEDNHYGMVTMSVFVNEPT